MNAPLRRGSCPGLSAPMQTGDGLLVRLLPIGTVPLAAFAALCAAARECGNGVVEVTARGSIQVRGLSPPSAPRFAAAVAALGIAADDGIAVYTSPLSGLDSAETLDAQKLAADLRRALAEYALGAKLAPKISVAIDGGGALGLDGLTADVRLRAELNDGSPVLDVRVGGDRRSAAHIGFVAPKDAVAATMRFLEAIARRGCDLRARDIVNNEGVESFRLVVPDLLLTSARPRASGDQELDSRLRGNERKSVIGLHPLRCGSLACGVGLAFGHAEATSLENLAGAAAARGATGLRAATDRALIFIGFSPEPLSAFATDAERLGFVVRAGDPRRFVVACAGAPICASAHIAARGLAPRIAAACAGALGQQFTIHVSGCAKGCAHAGPSALTVVGIPEGCGLVVDGSARDAPFATMTEDKLPGALVRHARAATGEIRHV